MSRYNFDYTKHLSELLPLLKTLISEPEKHAQKWHQFIKRFPAADGSLFSKDQVIIAYRALAGSHGLPDFDQTLIKQWQLKPVRTQSGVTPVTVLTKPFPCPGKCIFCPSDVRMPKSYLSDEPGAQRAERNYFDPYLQTYNRLQALYNMGHDVSKVEIIVLGGTWSFYPEPYQIWFIKECFRALNDFCSFDGRDEILKRYDLVSAKLKDQDSYVPSNDPVHNKKQTLPNQITDGDLTQTYNQVISEMYVAPERKAGLDAYQKADWDELDEQHLKNETAAQRCVGLVIETRPDNISEKEVMRIRKLGCTKAQIGVQSLQDEVLDKNNRGHDVAATRRAFSLLRQAGFKIHAHWMANLYGSSVEKDKKDYEQLFEDPDFKPDELKVYPCSLIDSAELMQYYKKGLWKPYSFNELLEVVTHGLSHTPAYCRLTRVIRDIPSPDIVDGNKLTNFRQIAEQAIKDRKIELQDIRSREIRNQEVDQDQVYFETQTYQTSVSQEHFIQVLMRVENGQSKLLGFLRLSFPTQKSFVSELEDAAVIREIHIYGPAQGLGKRTDDTAQHTGFGTQLIERAKNLSQKEGFKKMAVISSVGTRQYYRKKGFKDGELYQFYELDS